MGGGIGSAVYWFQNALYRLRLPTTATAATTTATIAAVIAAHCYFLTAIFCNFRVHIVTTPPPGIRPDAGASRRVSSLSPIIQTQRQRDE